MRGGAAASTAVPAAGTYSAASSAVTALLQTFGVIAAYKVIAKGVESIGQNFQEGAETAKFLLAGAVAGIVSRTAVSPLEVVATLQMVQGGGNAGGLRRELATLYQKEGLAGFFKGNAANCLKVAPTRGVQFFCFEALKTKLMQYKLQQKKDRAIANGEDAADAGSVSLTPVERLVAGGMAGMVASSMVYPLEVVKTMLTLYPDKYTGIASACRGVLADAGFKGFYKGLGPTLLAMFPYVGVEFMIYETSKIAIEAILTRRRDESQEGSVKATKSGGGVAIPVIVSLGLGAIAGACAQTSAHPFDVVRKRLQVQGLNGNPILYRGSLACFRGVAAKEGVSALYKGLRPACVATIPGTGIAYITYEVMKKVLGLSSV